MLIKKGDFLCLFWAAWVKTFTKKLILSAFESTRLIHFNSNVILNKFVTKEPKQPETPKPI